MLKTEPSTFGVDDLQAAPRRTTRWDGVRNYQARNYIRDQIKKGDDAFLYHSSCEVPGIVAILRVVRAAYPDPTAFNRRDPHFDPGSNAQMPRWFTFDVQLKRRLKRVIALSELQAHARDALASMMILRAGNRLSVTPIEPAHWRFILALE
ncbi:MAG TPA: EVE domain-containing protein [Steroidobacteraceae bacterium]